MAARLSHPRINSRVPRLRGGPVPVPPCQQQPSCLGKKGTGCFRDTAPAPPWPVHHFAHIYSFAKDSDIKPHCASNRAAVCSLSHPHHLHPAALRPHQHKGGQILALPFRGCAPAAGAGGTKLCLPPPRCRADASPGAASLWHGRREHPGPV